MEELKNFYTVRELADAIDVTPDTVRTLIRTGKLKASKFNGAYIIDREAAEAIIKQRSA